MRYFFLVLLFGFLCCGDLSAQVGINNDNPSQALDVGGKIKVGDDQIAPVAGTIRYNRVTRTFEGYDGTEWSVFNPEEDDGGGNTNASDSYVVASETFSGSSTDWNVDWKGATGGSSFVEVPSGRTLFVTSIIIQSAGSFDFTFFPSGSSGFPLLGRTLNVADNVGGRTQQLNDPNGQLLIIPPGGRLDVIRFSGNARVFLRGFLQ